MGDFGGKVTFFPARPGRAPGRVPRYWRAIRTTPARHLCYKALRKGYERLNPRGFPFPRWVHLEVTNACNLDCIMCPRQEMDRPVGFMDVALFEKLIEQMRPMRRYIEGVALMGLGEPLLHKRFFDMARTAKRAGFTHVYTSTNAALLDAERTRRILDDGALDRIIFSVDGVTKETYESIRVKGDFDAVMANIETFLEEKRRRGAARPHATLQMLVMDRTAAEIDAFLARWVPLLGPTDDILIKTVDTFGGQVGDFRTDVSLRPPERTPCRQLWKDLSVSWDGRVTVCCKDVLYRLKVGDAANEDLRSIWNGAKWNAIRNAHQAGCWNMPPCDRCDEWYL